MVSPYQYSLVVENDSSNGGTFVVFQQDPGLGVTGLLPLAWLTKNANPTTQIVFSWSVDYDFVWYDSGELVPGILCVASQTWPAGLSTTNQVTLTRNGNGYTFASQTAGPAAGNLYVVQDGSVASDAVTVGIGMSGSGSLVVQAQPNVTTRFASPSPEIWLAFSLQEITRGEVLDPGQLPAPNVRIDFPQNVFTMKATLDAGNAWSVVPVTAAALAAAEELPT